ncbi:hypothetical protein AMECASPLE_038675, partial [Ameca splendens]
IKPTLQVKTSEGEPYLQHPERTVHSELENVEAALQRFPAQARGFPHTSTESRTGMSRQIRFSGALSHPAVIDSHEQYLAMDSVEVNSSRYRGEQPSNLTCSTLLYEPSPPTRRQESHLWDSGFSYRVQPLPRTQFCGLRGPQVYHEQPLVPPPKVKCDALTHHGCSRSESSDDDSNGPGPIPESGLRTRQLESLAQDIERFTCLAIAASMCSISVSWLGVALLGNSCWGSLGLGLCCDYESENII